ncbi:serine hydrolase [Chryseolinea lacunae]|uniref:Serine hydrolase n=1 Tax=Chryseolinea lacunae TaxID=2801331 RepID=A0ABS1KUJ8_9BACT|nr:serine hydrolase [Chryseolinea lacunae]MBL0743131.1 serine hydrolase [Chryseolinea lacunae]
MKYVFAIGLLTVALSASSQDQSTVTRIDSVVTWLHSRQMFNGTVLVANHGKVLYKKAFGMSNPTTKTSLTPASSFNLASVSKQFFAMMVMMLKERGKLEYDDAVQKYLPIFPYPNVTIRHLLNQTSGLPEYFDLAQANMSLLDTLTNTSMLDLLAYKKVPLTFLPGTKWEYCNTNYTTLASVIEKVSGVKCDEFFRKNITMPLKMTNTYIYHLKMKSYPASRVFGFGYDGGKPVLNDLTQFDGIVGDGNVYASAEDLLKWDQALYTEKLVKRETLKEAFTPAKLLNGESTRYGFGWFIDDGGRRISHTGSWVGFNTQIIRKVDTHETLIVLDNGSRVQGRPFIVDVWEGKKATLLETELITNVKLITGVGLPAYSASVRIVGDRIRDIGALAPYENERVTNGNGAVLSPGFIDSHSHHDRGLSDEPTFLAAISQGITTVVVGQDGDSDPIDSLQRSLKRTPISLNLATYTGHATLRQHVMRQRLFRAARQSEVDSMKTLLLREMDKGSLGLATGLEYEAAFFSNREEVIELAKVVASKGGRYISHIRSEDIHIEEAVKEIVDIGRQAKLPVQISHIKIALRSAWGTSPSILNRLQKARMEGINITADVYPYAMWMSTPRVLFPNKDFNNEKSAVFATEELFDPSKSVMLYFSADRSYEGKTVSEIAALHHESPPRALMRLIKEADEKKGSAGIAGYSMSETDIVNFLQWPHANVCSDGAPDGHPRGHGAFTRVLGTYVRDQKIMPLETAIYKMTGLTAEHLGFKNRGIIAPGYFADLVLFDPATVKDNATMKDPMALSTGILKVWVNGRSVYENQKSTGNFPGRFITR